MIQIPKSQKLTEVVSGVLLGGIIIRPIFPISNQYSLQSIFNLQFAINLLLLGSGFFATAKSNSPNKVFFVILFFLIVFYWFKPKL